MKTLALLTAFAVAMPAAAQSVADTHDLSWRPAGKTPHATYRPREATCAATGRHLSGKMMFVPRGPCVEPRLASSPTSPSSDTASATTVEARAPIGQ
jgi:hypothetical protein